MDELIDLRRWRRKRSGGSRPTRCATAGQGGTEEEGDGVLLHGCQRYSSINPRDGGECLGLPTQSAARPVLRAPATPLTPSNRTKADKTSKPGRLRSAPLRNGWQLFGGARQPAC